MRNRREHRQGGLHVLIIVNFEAPAEISPMSFGIALPWLNGQAGKMLCRPQIPDFGPAVPFTVINPSEDFAGSPK